MAQIKCWEVGIMCMHQVYSSSSMVWEWEFHTLCPRPHSMALQLVIFACILKGHAPSNSEYYAISMGLKSLWSWYLATKLLTARLPLQFSVLGHIPYINSRLLIQYVNSLVCHMKAYFLYLKSLLEPSLEWSCMHLHVAEFCIGNLVTYSWTFYKVICQ